MKLCYSASKNERINYNFYGVRVQRRSKKQPAMWYSENTKTWVPRPEVNRSHDFYGTVYSHHHSGSGAPKTARGIRRYLRKHPELKGYIIVFVNNYAGHNITVLP